MSLLYASSPVALRGLRSRGASPQKDFAHVHIEFIYSQNNLQGINKKWVRRIITGPIFIVVIFMSGQLDL